LDAEKESAINKIVINNKLTNKLLRNEDMSKKKALQGLKYKKEEKTIHNKHHLKNQSLKQIISVN
jgi:hypothetical protein